MKFYFKFIIPITLLIAFFIFIESNAPQQLSWETSFEHSDKMPYGSYAIHTILKDVFKKQPLFINKYSLYDSFKKTEYRKSNILIVTRNFSIDKYDLKTMDTLLKEGTSILIAAERYAGKFAKKYNLETSHSYSVKPHKLRLTNNRIKKSTLHLKKQTVSYHFTKFKKNNTKIIAVNNKHQPVIMNIQIGKGNIILCSHPKIFTNITLLDKQNHIFISQLLSYMPLQTTFWDNYYKPYKLINRSPLRFILLKPQLKWAYYVAMITLIIFIIFKGKRMQRSIAIKKPLSNTTLEFVETVGRLYYQQAEHKNIIEKRITYFLDYIKSKLYVNTSGLTTDDYKKIAAKSKSTVKEIRDIFTLINRVKAQEAITERELKQLNNRIEKFYTNTKQI